MKENKYLNKNILIYGFRRSGKATLDFLKANGAKAFIYDDFVEEYKNINFDITSLDLVVVSPGVNEKEKLYQDLEKNKAKMISELELGFQNVKGDIIAITGTNGKTTTVSLLSYILGGEKNNCFLAGNIGTPLISLWDKTNCNSKIICEVSSFQLNKVEMFSPRVSAILNLAPDHIDRHGSFKNYIKAKSKIFKNQNRNDTCILNYDDKNTKKLSKKTHSKILYFSMKNQEKNKKYIGVFLKNEAIYFKIAKKAPKFVVSTENVKLFGNKNIENIMCAVTIALLQKVSIKKIQSNVLNFEPLPNRLEIAGQKNNITYINDSKATNIASSLADIEAIETKCVVMVGGSDKNEDFRLFFKKLSSNVLQIVAYGAVQEKIKLSAGKCKYSNIIFCENFKKAFIFAEQFCESFNEKVCLLLAPACASFDEFENYEKRGEKFKEFVSLS